MDELRKNDILEAFVESYGASGEGVCRINGRAVFVRGGILGERCRIKILKVTKTAAWAKAEEILDPSPHRVTSPCHNFPKCGGCALLHMDYEEQLRFKRQRVDDAFARIGGLDLKCEEIIGAAEPWNYRNKAVFNVEKGADGKPVIGFYRERSHDVIPTENCAIESGYANRAAKVLRKWMDAENISAYDEKTKKGVRRLFCRFGFESGEGQTVLVTGAGVIPADSFVSSLLESCPETVSVLRNINTMDGNTVIAGRVETVYGKETVEDTLCANRFSVAAEAFYQVNRAQAERLYEKAMEYAAVQKDETALDLFCGAGTITLRLAKDAVEAVGVEIVERAIENAKENAARNGVENVRFFAGDAGETVEKLVKEGFRPNVVTVDPPRKGLLPGTAEMIASLEPERIVYVSCDCATQARDLKIFKELGYTPRRACAVDMFPHTHHVESVVLLSR